MHAKKVLIILIIVAVIVVAWIAFCGYQWSWGPFHRLHDIKTSKLPGNAAQYAPEKQPRLEESALTGKRIVFLGSSVTYGAASKGVSFADYLAVRNGCECIKEAVFGTTLVDNGVDSYISRLNRLAVDGNVDLFVCQLSTNDATQKKPIGGVGDSFVMNEFDTKTVAGAIEYIIAFAKETYDCPVVFYTNPVYDSAAYADMVELLNQIAQKWDIAVIDMWNDEAFNSISEDQRGLYMADAIHPSQAGYLEWWTPYFESTLEEILK